MADENFAKLLLLDSASSATLIMQCCALQLLVSPSLLFLVKRVEAAPLTKTLMQHAFWPGFLILWTILNTFTVLYPPHSPLNAAPSILANLGLSSISNFPHFTICQPFVCLFRPVCRERLLCILETDALLVFPTELLAKPTCELVRTFVIHSAHASSFGRITVTCFHLHFSYILLTFCKHLPYLDHNFLVILQTIMFLTVLSDTLSLCDLWKHANQ